MIEVYYMYVMKLRLQLYIYSLSENIKKKILEVAGFGPGFKPSSGFIQYQRCRKT
jgi:hypothetical protein